MTALKIFIWALLNCAAIFASDGVPSGKRFTPIETIASNFSPSCGSSSSSREAHGTFVNLCHDNKNNRQVVIKAAHGRDKEELTNEGYIYGLVAEIPGVVKRFETIYETVNKKPWRYEVLEYCSGGDLFKLLKENGGLSEEGARPLIKQAATTLFLLHELNIVHLDIKPQNLFLKEARVFVGDFGHSHKLKEGQLLRARIGTESTWAPEVHWASFDKPYDPKKADVYSLGITLSTLLLGFPIYYSLDEFNKDGTKNIHAQCFLGARSAGSVVKAYANKGKKVLSPTVLNLISQMMHLDPARRASMREVLSHPWFKDPKETSESKR